MFLLFLELFKTFALVVGRRLGLVDRRVEIAARRVEDVFPPRVEVPQAFFPFVAALRREQHRNARSDQGADEKSGDEAASGTLAHRTRSEAASPFADGRRVTRRRMPTLIPANVAPMLTMAGETASTAKLVTLPAPLATVSNCPTTPCSRAIVTSAVLAIPSMCPSVRVTGSETDASWRSTSSSVSLSRPSVRESAEQTISDPRPIRKTPNPTPASRTILQSNPFTRKPPCAE